MPIYGQRTDQATEPVAHRSFELHAERAPKRLAVTCGERAFTYGQLNERANQLAHFLVANGVGPGSVVGVCLDRSPELVASILGILKAGAAYSPLDTTYPDERLALMTAQLDTMEWVVASTRTRSLVDRAEAQVLDVDAVAPGLATFPTTNPQRRVTGDDLCYVVFTSGSTGPPKATAVRHAGWHNLLSWLRADFGLDDWSSNLHISSMGFDISQRSLMTPLFTGATLHLLPSRNFDAMLANRLVARLGIRTLHCAPSALYLMMEREASHDTGALDTVQYVFVGGEPLSARRVRDWPNRPERQGRLVNVYGVAECSDVSTFHVLEDFAGYTETGVPIGRPIHNTDIHLLDEDLQPVAHGDVGEICIAGAGVGAGYLNAEALTRTRFVPAPAVGVERLYRTGDLGRLRPDGAIACIGRVDDQVKVRGMRIDLGDVETTLRRSERIHDAVVVAVKDEHGETDLVAHVILSATYDGESDEPALRAEAAALLPRHMVPRSFVVVDRFPLTPNGKVDRAALSRTPATRAPIGASAS